MKWGVLRTTQMPTVPDHVGKEKFPRFIRHGWPYWGTQEAREGAVPRCEGSRLREGLSREGGEEGSVSPRQQDAGVSSHHPPCLPEASLRPGPERRRPGTCCRRRSEASAGGRCRKQSRVPLSTTVAAAAPPGSPQPHMAAAARPRSARARSHLPGGRGG